MLDKTRNAGQAQELRNPFTIDKNEIIYKIWWSIRFSSHTTKMKRFYSHNWVCFHLFEEGLYNKLRNIIVVLILIFIIILVYLNTTN